MRTTFNAPIMNESVPLGRVHHELIKTNEFFLVIPQRNKKKTFSFFFALKGISIEKPSNLIKALSLLRKQYTT